MCRASHSSSTASSSHWRWPSPSARPIHLIPAKSYTKQSKFSSILLSSRLAPPVFTHVQRLHLQLVPLSHHHPATMAYRSLPTDPAVLYRTPVAPPPPGVTSNFVNPASNGGTYIAIATTFLTIMAMFISLRVYSKICIAKKLTPDDCKKLDVLSSCCRVPNSTSDCCFAAAVGSPAKARAET